MTFFSPIPSYILGTLFTLSGIISFISPATEYRTFGLPLTSSNNSKPDSSSSASPPSPQISPYVYAKGIRDLTYGFTYFIFQLQGQESAITTFTGIVCIAGFVDGILVWRFVGGWKGKAFEHWGAIAVLGSWAVWRAMSV
ncbi:hypothetical protein ONS95_005310 [Cadophora gregata]|uniref:uncharacterized protein n=1 Tax=Cadophora gregata TaxID=51156 RepID=UPI0026DB69A5|nr:uncharacterized protein ONS95_005310 [Cadophora gregata]KAK0103277.1 hypothetical protein ONS95_005310 [Cadophora gregata]KAK0107470.1 hypothetical protein ONS96_003283 [Cadophora gregata f. sp. sojae]